jgi:hypothetical protein
MNLPTYLRFSVGMTVVALATSVSAQVSPNAAEADRLFHDGQAALDAGRVAEACNLLRDSQRLDPKLGRLLNLAFCHERQGSFAAAWREFSAATAWASQKGQDERASFARVHAEKVAAKLSLVKLEFSGGREPGSIQIDGEVVPREGWTLPIPLDPGEHPVVVSGDHKKSAQLTFVATVGSTTLVIPGLEDEVVAAPAPVSPPEVAPVEAPTVESPAPLMVAAPVTPALVEEDGSIRSGGHGKRTFGWISEGVGVAALGAGVYFGLAAAGKKSDADPHCPAPAKLCDTAGQALIGEARTDAIVSTINIGVGVAALGLGTYMLLTSHEAKPRTSGVHIIPGVGPRSASVGLEGTW